MPVVQRRSHVELAIKIWLYGIHSSLLDSFAKGSDFIAGFTPLIMTYA